MSLRSKTPIVPREKYQNIIKFQQSFKTLVTTGPHGEFEPGKAQYSTPNFFWPVVSYKSVSIETQNLASNGPAQDWKISWTNHRLSIILDVGTGNNSDLFAD